MHDDGRRRARLVAALFACANLVLVQCACRGAVPSPKEEVERLMNAGMPSARKMLAERGEFHPFGAAMDAHGEVRLGTNPGIDPPAALDLIGLLEDGYRKGAESGQYRATAIFAIVHVQPPGESVPTDAVEVMLEHRQGYCVNVFFPYSRGRTSDVTYGAFFAVPRKGAIFPRCGDQG